MIFRHLLLVLFVIVININLQGQNIANDSIKQDSILYYGWEYLFNGEFEKAKKCLLNAYKSNQGNYATGLVILGITTEDSALLKFISKEKIDEKISSGYINFVTAIALRTPLNVRRNSANFNYDEIKSFYQGGKFETKDNFGRKQIGEYKDGKKVGTWKEYWNDSALKKTITYLDSLKTRERNYSKNGILITEEIMLRTNNIKSTLEKRIFYQEVPDTFNHYLLVSDTGFITLRHGKRLKLGDHTPDNFMEETLSTDTSGEIIRTIYIWKNGKKVIYKQCQGTDPTKPGISKWTNCIIHYKVEE